MARFIQSARSPASKEFLDALEISDQDRASLIHAINEFGRPTLLETNRAVVDFIKSRSAFEVEGLNDLGNRIVPSHLQGQATSAWSHALKRFPEVSRSFGLVEFDAAVEDYLRFSSKISRAALEADAGEGIDGIDATHATLAIAARWHRLEPILRMLEVRLGKRGPEFLAWARAVEPDRAEELLFVTDLIGKARP